MVSSRLVHPLILGTDWPGFNKLAGQCAGVLSRLVGTRDMRVELSGDARLSDAVDWEGEPVVLSQEAPQVPVYHSMEDFPLEQAHDDTLRFAPDQVIKIDGQLVRPDAAQAYPHFALIRDRLYRVSHDRVSPRGLRNMLSRSSAPAHYICKECGTVTVSGHLLSGDPKRHPD